MYYSVSQVWAFVDEYGADVILTPTQAMSIYYSVGSRIVMLCRELLELLAIGYES